MRIYEDLRFHFDDTGIIVNTHHLNHNQIRLNKLCANNVVFIKYIFMNLAFCTHNAHQNEIPSYLCVYTQKEFSFTRENCLLVARTKFAPLLVFVSWI